ncbi:MAG: sugar transferase [Velocimicrobium sp.]
MYRRSTSSWIKHFDFMCWDLICLMLTLTLSYGLRNGFQFIFNRRLYMTTAAMMMLIDIFVVFLGESYKGIVRRGYWNELVAVFKHNTYVMGITVFYLFITQNGQIYSRMVILLHWLSASALMYFVRIIWKSHIKKRNIQGNAQRAMLLVCARDDAAKIIQTMHENEYGRVRLVGVIFTKLSGHVHQVEGVPVVASGSEQALDYIKKNWVDEVFIKLPKDDDQFNTIIDTCMEMGVTVHLELAKLLHANRQTVEKIGGYTVISSSVNMANTKQLIMKRMLDICGGIVGVLITGVLFLFVAPLIYLRSPGPIFFKQERVGKNGKRFGLYKFRSMYIDAEAKKEELLAMNEMATTLMFKMEDDPRIIGGEKGIGGFIRRTSIDEFPQFLNVLKGEMSLVGTRPPTVDEWNQYQFHHRKRLATKPGITGMWQVSGRSNIKDFEDVVKLDTQYINEWTFGMDMRILAKTVLVVLKRDGSV